MLCRCDQAVTSFPDRILKCCSIFLKKKKSRKKEKRNYSGSKILFEKSQLGSSFTRRFRIARNEFHIDVRSKWNFRFLIHRRFTFLVNASLYTLLYIILIYIYLYRCPRNAWFIEFLLRIGHRCHRYTLLRESLYQLFVKFSTTYFNFFFLIFLW